MQLDPDLMDFDEAIEHIMRATGKTRRQAKAALIEACRQGKIPTFYKTNDETIRVPPESFPVVN